MEKILGNAFDEPAEFPRAFFCHAAELADSHFLSLSVNLNSFWPYFLNFFVKKSKKREKRVH